MTSGSVSSLTSTCTGVTSSAISACGAPGSATLPLTSLGSGGGACDGPRHVRTLEHAESAAAVALDADETVALTRLQQVHQAAKAVAALVEVAGAEDLLHVAQVHRPARIRGIRQQLRRGADAVGVVAKSL